MKVATKAPKSKALHPLTRRGRKPKDIAGDLFHELDCPCGEQLAIAGPKAFIDVVKRAWDKRHAGH